MLSIKNLVTIACFTFSFFCLADMASAQRAPLKVNQGFRWLGHFQSTGYHWRTQGPCVNYYNPYSHHNSSLRIGGSPQGSYGYAGGTGYGCSDCAGGFDQPGSYGYGDVNSQAAIAPGGRTVVESEVDNEVYEGEGDNGSGETTEEDIDAEAKSILDQIEALDKKMKDTPAAESKERVDGASLWSDVFELSRVDRSKIQKRAAANQRIYGQRK